MQAAGVGPALLQSCRDDSPGCHPQTGAAAQLARGLEPPPKSFVWQTLRQLSLSEMVARASAAHH